MPLNYGPIVATGSDWIGKGVGSALFALHELLTPAHVHDEVHVLAYSITSGSDELLKLVADNLARGKKVTMIVNRIPDQPDDVVRRLTDLALAHEHFLLYSYEAERSDLHAKVVVVDRREAMIGSSNLSGRGLHYNFELGVIVNGDTAWVTADLVDRLIDTSAVRRWTHM